jgi:hypothetical protein
MALPVHPAFVHRGNRDGTIDSICRQCYLTVCTSVWEAELDQAEKHHDCNPDQLAHWRRSAGRQPIDDAKS